MLRKLCAGFKQAGNTGRKKAMGINLLTLRPVDHLKLLLQQVTHASCSQQNR